LIGSLGVSDQLPELNAKIVSNKLDGRQYVLLVYIYLHNENLCFIVVI